MRKLRITDPRSHAQALLAISVALLSLTACSAAGDSPTFGTIPQAVFEAGVPVEADALPDYIAVAGDSDAPLGYIEAPFAWTVIGQEEAAFVDGPIPVVDTSLNLVGHLWPSKGFVPVGTDPNSVPGLSATTTYGTP